LIEINHIFNGRVKTAFSSNAAVAEAIKTADLIIGAVLIPGAAAPKLIRREQLKTLLPGAVLVDIAIDQGGCFESSHATTHQDPIFMEDGIVHYCVANMPSAVARTSTLALNSATLPFIVKMANQGVEQALQKDIHLAAGLNIADGVITHRAVAEALQL
ncbi:MAG TPA: alanine dehydrogenase, partial [Cellvibrionaceae bacterium]|nr:alanine dehydrogenase [Cellvibrionaceae bacterium]